MLAIMSIAPNLEVVVCIDVAIANEFEKIGCNW
jgi:hypothetical protein